MPRAAEIEELLNRLRRPAEIVVLTAPGCPNCRQTVEAAQTLAAINPKIVVRVLDATVETELAARWRVRSVPTAVVDGELTLVGAIGAEALARRMLELEGPEAELAVLRSLLVAGRLDAVGARLGAEVGREAFARLWRQSALEGRMGLMLAAEEAIEGSAVDLEVLVPHLLPILAEAEPALAGDTADLLGLIGSPAARPALQTLAGSDDPDVAEAAADALDRLRRDDR